MIRLTEIVKEITFGRGHASSNNIEDISSDAIYQNNIDDDIERDGDYDDLKIPITDPKFKRAIKQKFEVIGQVNGYKLIKSKQNRYGDINYYLTNPSANYSGEYFVGIIKTQLNQGDFYNLKKGFGVEIETVHWSNVALELRGSGMGKAMYTMVYEYLKNKGRAFGSDSMLFEGSAGMWMTYMPTIAKYFGVIINDIMVPINREDMTKKNKPVFDMYGVDGFVAMETPPPMVRKIMYNVKGLSFIKGEYGIVRMPGGVNDMLDVTDIKKFHGKSRENPFRDTEEDEESTFIDYVNNFDTLKALMRSPLDYNVGQIIGAKKTKFKTLIFAFNNAVLVVKELPSGLSVVPL